MPEDSLVITHLDVYRSIALEAAEESQRLLNEHRRPKPNGEPGYIITWDPDRRSFKQAMIAIAFAGMYLEALIRILKMKRRRSGGGKRKKSASPSRYRSGLEALGVTDKDLLEATAHFNDARDDLLHETPMEVSLLPGAVNHDPHYDKHFTAQTEAEKAADLIQKVSAVLLGAPKAGSDAQAPAEGKNPKERPTP
jgi:hypothetical protein